MTWLGFRKRLDRGPCSLWSSQAKRNLAAWKELAENALLQTGLTVRRTYFALNCLFWCA